MNKPIEHYYAIRIGDPRRHCAYFKVCDGELTPQLFLQRKDAERECVKGQRVVKVVVRQP